MTPYRTPPTGAADESAAPFRAPLPKDPRVEVVVENTKWKAGQDVLARKIEARLNEGWRLIAFSDAGEAYTCIYERGRR